MLLDQNAVFSEEQSLSASAASTNIMDLTAAGNTVPAGAYFMVTLPTKFTGTGTLTIALQTDSAQAFSSAVTLFSVAFTQAALGTDGAKLCAIPLPAGLKRYLRVYYTISGVSGGKVSAFITDGIESK